MMNFKLSHIILTLTINLPLLLFSIQPIQAQTQDNNPEGLLYDSLPPLPSASEYNVLPEIKPYTLDIGDVVRVSVFGVEAVGGIDDVFTDGTITLPLLGNVYVKGLTLAELNDLMTESYGRFVKRPLITVVLERARSLEVGIIGEVNTPGNYTISALGSGLNNNNSNVSNNPNSIPTSAARPKVTDLFDLADGLTVSANVKQIKLKRKENGQEIVYNLDFWKLLQEGDLDQDALLQDGDVIIVQKQDEINPKEYRQLIDANFGIKYIKPPNVTVVGEVNRPGAYKLSIEGGPPTLTTVLQQSGGIKELADIRNIVITRTTRDTQERIIVADLWDMLQSGDVKKDVVLREGDTITVPKAKELLPSEAEELARANISPATITVNVVGQVQNPGAKALPPNTSLNKALQAAGGFQFVRANQSTVELLRINRNGTTTKRKIKVDFAADVNEENNPVLKNNDVVVVNRNALTAVGDGIATLVSPLRGLFSFTNFLRIFTRGF